MNNHHINETFSELSTPLIADARLRLEILRRFASPGIRPLTVESHIAGRVLPVRHYGSVDIFLEAREQQNTEISSSLMIMLEDWMRAASAI